MDERRRPLSPSLIVAVLAFALFALVHQARLDKDSVLFIKWYAEGKLDYYHPLYLPLATGFARLLGAAGIEAASALRLYSCVCGAAATLFVHRIAWAASGRRGYALFAAALFAVSPSVLYFSTLPELNMGGIALLSASVLATDRAARRESGLDVAAALLLGLACAHHTANALCWPGLVLLFALAGGRVSVRRVLAFAAASAAAVVLLALVIPRIVFSLCSLEVGSEYGTDLVLQIFRTARWKAAAVYVLDQFVFFAGWLLPLGVAGAASTPPRIWRLLALVATALPAMVVFGVWDRADTGAYYMPLYPFLVWYGAGIPHRVRDKGLVATLLVITQAALGSAFLWRHNRVDHERLWREGLVRTIEEKGLQRDDVVVLVFGFQRALDLDLFVPGVRVAEVTDWRDKETRDWDFVLERLEKDLLPDVKRGRRYLLDAEAVREELGIRPPGLGWIAQGPPPASVLEGTRFLGWLTRHFDSVTIEKPGFKAFWLEPRP